MKLVDSFNFYLCASESYIFAFSLGTKSHVTSKTVSFDSTLYKSELSVVCFISGFLVNEFI